MGSAALYHLARRGKRVLGLERFDVSHEHEHGSSHGLTRIIRLAYFEHVAYVPLVRRAYELWRELEAEAGERLLHVTGIVEAGDRIYDGTLRACHEHDLPHETIDGREVGRRFPAYRLPPDLPVVFQPDGGFVLPERCIVAHVTGALAAGAVVRARERVLEWDDTGSGVRVTTDRRVVEADRLVLTAGAWSQDVARPPRGLVRGVRQALAWLQPAHPASSSPTASRSSTSRSTATTSTASPRSGSPASSSAATTTSAREATPTRSRASRRSTTRRRCARSPSATSRRAPGPAIAVKTCLFEPSPDEHFLIDRHPDAPHAVLGAGFSGHGFKFCSVVGEILADLALDGATRHDIGFLRLDRFGDEKCDT